MAGAGTALEPVSIAYGANITRTLAITVDGVAVTDFAGWTILWTVKSGGDYVDLAGANTATVTITNDNDTDGARAVVIQVTATHATFGTIGPVRVYVSMGYAVDGNITFVVTNPQNLVATIVVNLDEGNITCDSQDLI